MTDEQRRAADIADKIIARTRYRPGTDNYARVFQAAYAAAIEALTRAETPQSIPSEREEIVALTDALRKLAHEVEGSLTAFDLGVRAEIGNTNYALIMQRLSEAYTALDRASEHLTRQALEQGSAQGSRATASRQPAGGPSDPSRPTASRPIGAHQVQSQNVPALGKELPKIGRRFPSENGPETPPLKTPAVESRTVSLTLGEVAEIFIAGCQRGSDEAIAFERGSAASGARDDDLAAALCEIVNAGKHWGDPGYIAYGTLAQVWDNALAARVAEDAQ